jgi:poly-gamma-glutamate capsule biosynthesis protein CapA/YwtB (metallophosphatase superfamily)
VISLAVVLALGAGPDAAEGFTLAVGGDVMLARGVSRQAERDGWDAVLAPLTRALAGAQASLVNFESPLGTCRDAGSVPHPRLCAPAAAAPALDRAHVTAVGVANNHALDASGLAETAARLRRAGVVLLGAPAARTGHPSAERLGPLVVVAANLSRPAWPPGRALPLPAPAEVARTVEAARRRHPDLPVLVTLHGGRELDLGASTFEETYARAAAEAGAAAVVFHGSHVVHPLVHIAGVPCHLGLGNLLFDQRDPRTGGQVLILRFHRGQPASVVELRDVPRAN